MRSASGEPNIEIVMKWLAALSLILLTVAAIAYLQIEPAPPPAPSAAAPATEPKQVVGPDAEMPPVAPPGPAPADPVGDTGSQLIREIEQALVSVDDNERDRVYMQLLPELISRDANAAARLVEKTAPGQVRTELLGHVARLWAATDIDGAISWASRLKDEADRTTAATEMTTQLARTHPGNAIEVADLFAIGRDNGSVEHMAQMWATENLDAALKWVHGQPPGPRRDQLLARMVVAQAARDPLAAANDASGKLPAGSLRDEAVLGVVRQWAFSDPEAAAAWVERIPERPLRERARRDLAAIVQQSLGTQ